MINWKPSRVIWTKPQALEMGKMLVADCGGPDSGDYHQSLEQQAATDRMTGSKNMEVCILWHTVIPSLPCSMSPLDSYPPVYPYLLTWYFLLLNYLFINRVV